MATFDRAGPALATDATTGLTHMVWNQDGQVYAAYYDPVCRHWVDASAIPGSVTGQNLCVQPDLAILGADGQMVPALIASWTVGQGNQAEVYSAIGQRSPLGGYEWSHPVQLTRDGYSDDHASVVVTPDGQVVLVSRKTDADNPAADADHYVTTLTIDHRDLAYGTYPGTDSVIGADLPVYTGRTTDAYGTELPPGTSVVGYNFNFGLKFSNDKLPGPGGGKLPVIGGKQTKIELEIRLRGGYQEGDPDIAGFGAYDKVGVLRGEIKLAVKLFDMVTLGAYLQGTFVFGGTPGSEAAPTAFLGGRLTLGLQGKIEYAPPMLRAEAGSGDEKFAFAAGIVFDVRLQKNADWKPAQGGELPDDAIADFAKLVRADGSPALVGDDPSQLRWEINLEKLAPLLLGSLSELTETGPGGTNPNAWLAALGELPAETSSSERIIEGEYAVAPSTNPGSDAVAGVSAPIAAAWPFGGLAEPLFAAAELPPGETAMPLKYTATDQLSPGLGVFGKMQLTSFLEGKASLIVYLDFFRNYPSPFEYSNARARLDAEARLGHVTFRYRQEWVFGNAEGSDDAIRYESKEFSFAPRPGSGEVYGPGGILGEGVSADRVDDGPASLAVADDGWLLLAWVREAPNDSGDFSYVVVSESTDDGKTWSTPTVLPGSAGFNLDPVAAFDSQGRALTAVPGPITSCSAKPDWAAPAGSI